MWKGLLQRMRKWTDTESMEMPGSAKGQCEMWGCKLEWNQEEKLYW